MNDDGYQCEMDEAAALGFWRGVCAALASATDVHAAHFRALAATGVGVGATEARGECERVAASSEREAEELRAWAKEG